MPDKPSFPLIEEYDDEVTEEQLERLRELVGPISEEDLEIISGPGW